MRVSPRQRLRTCEVRASHESDHPERDHIYDAQVHTLSIARFLIVAPTMLNRGVAIRNGQLHYVVVTMASGQRGFAPSAHVWIQECLVTFGLFLFYAFTPLPSNFVFVAYGLTTMHLARLAIPFFLGRFVSYAFWTLSAAAVSRRFDFDEGKTLSYFSVYFVLTQSALLGTVYLFTRLDWKMLLREHKWKLVKRS
jgi:hypothetical protein